MYTLQGGTLVTGNGNVIVMRLADADFGNMMNITGLVRAKTSTYIIANKYLIQDVSKNYFTPILDGNALPCLVYVRDTSLPVLERIVFDVDEFFILFYMSKRKS